MSSRLDIFLPRISKLSKRFDKKESYTGKSWVLIDDAHRALMELEFFKDGRLLLIMNGNASWGKWEVSPNTNRLILDFVQKISVYEVSFVDQALMLARKSGTKNTEVFVNKKELPSLLFQFYLDSLVRTIERDYKSTTFERRSEPRQEFHRQPPVHEDRHRRRTGSSPLSQIWNVLTAPFKVLRNFDGVGLPPHKAEQLDGNPVNTSSKIIWTIMFILFIVYCISNLLGFT